MLFLFNKITIGVNNPINTASIQKSDCVSLHPPTTLAAMNTPAQPKQSDNVHAAIKTTNKKALTFI